MGILSDTMSSLLPVRKAAVATMIPIGTAGIPQSPKYSYESFAREGYSKNEIVYACIEERATSVGKPRWRAVRDTVTGADPVADHPAIRLLGRPNPWTPRSDFFAGIEMFLMVAGNAYIEKVRNRMGEVIELWLLRPDRVFPIPDPDRYVAGYEYRLNGAPYPLRREDVIHIKTRAVLDDFLGLPPLAVAAERVDTDNWMRSFTRNFLANAGVPVGLLNVMRQLSAEEKRLVQSRYRQEYGGQNVGNLLVIDADEAKYQPMGMPLGERGAALPELDEIDEARIIMVFQVPPSIIGARLGMGSSSYANRKSDREEYTVETVLPELERIGDYLTLGLLPEFGGADRLEVDPATVPALQEDQNARHERVRADYLAGIVTWAEARAETGREETPAAPSVVFVPVSGAFQEAPPEVVEPLDMTADQGGAADGDMGSMGDTNLEADMAGAAARPSTGAGSGPLVSRNGHGGA